MSEELEYFAADQTPDIEVRVCFGRKRCPVERIASDALQDYGYDGIMHYAVARVKGNVSMIATVYDDTFSHVTMWLNTNEFGDSLKQYCKILQHFPMREMLAQYHALLLHSSRIALPAPGGGEETIVFTAPSQTGKTTQARLWQRSMGARIVSNDRTLIRMVGGDVQTSGYPVDGSSPVCDPEKLGIRAIIILRQGKENTARRLKPSEAMPYLMEQTSADRWNAQEMVNIQMLWMDILERCPVWLYFCRPDESAVYALKEILEEDGRVCFAERNT